MKSSKQRKKELKAKQLAKQARQAKKVAVQATRRNNEIGKRLIADSRAVAVNAAALAPSHSYSDPEFVKRGYYVDQPFDCLDCGKAETWTAAQQKWWYEVAKGSVWTTGRRCRSCRHKERERRDEARRVHLDGIARKHREAT